MTYKGCKRWEIWTDGEFDTVLLCEDDAKAEEFRVKYYPNSELKLTIGTGRVAVRTLD